MLKSGSEVIAYELSSKNTFENELNLGSFEIFTLREHEHIKILFNNTND